MNIVFKTTLDIVPKAIMLMIIAELKKFFTSEFHIAVASSEDDLMRETAEEREYRETMMKTFTATQKALGVINDMCAKGISMKAPVPPRKNGFVGTLQNSENVKQPLRPPPRLAPKPGQNAVPV